MRKRHFFKITLLLLSLTLSIVIAEIGLGIFFKDLLAIKKDERNLMYKYDKELGWFPVANSRMHYKGSRKIKVRHNSKGFRDQEHRVDDDKPSIVFLGDSFVWGYDVEASERFTEKLRKKHPDWSIYNLGISGYGTDQQYLLIKEYFDFYDPDMVFLVFCTENDEDDNSWNVRYDGYFKPYFMVYGDIIELNGVPVPRSENYFFANHKFLSRSNILRLLVKAYFKLTTPSPDKIKNPTLAIIKNMQKFVSNKGALLVVGLQDEHPKLEKFLQRHDIPYVDLGNSHRYSSKGEHWTPKGHTVVCNRISEFLVEGEYLVQ